MIRRLPRSTRTDTLFPYTTLFRSGNAEIKAATGCCVTGPAAESVKIPTLDRLVKEGDTVMLGEHAAHVIEVPSHTSVHIASHMPAEPLFFIRFPLFPLSFFPLFVCPSYLMFFFIPLLFFLFSSFSLFFFL